MHLNDLLLERRQAVLDKWFQRIAATYPEDARRFLMSESNAFANPVGSSISAGMNCLYDALVDGTEIETELVSKFLDRIIRIRAVQDFSPGEAVGFVFVLKEIVRETLGDELRRGDSLEQLLTFDSRVDKVALLAFNIYMQCREKIYELRAKEIRDRTSRILQRACQIVGSGGKTPEEVLGD